MKYFEFVNSVKILCGQDAVYNLAFELDYYNCNKPMILSDNGLKKLQIPEIVIKAMGKKNYFMYTDIPIDSSIETINQITKLYKKEKCDGIIAVGGGSVIDTAKGVRLSISQNENNLSKLSGNEIIKVGSRVPFFVIPTTSGTGSECTGVAVIKDDQTHIKQEYISQELLPNVAILDCSFTKSLPPKLTITTAFDALTHAIEAYTSLQKNPISDIYATTAIKLIANNLILAVNKNDIEARNQLALASCLAGVAFSNAMVGIVHAIGHAVGGYKQIPHGDAMTVLLPHCIKYNMDKCSKEYGQLLLYLTNEEKYVTTPKDKRANQFVVEIKNLLNKLQKRYNVKTKLSDYNITQEDFDEIATRALNDGAAIVNRKKIKKQDIIDILQQSL